MTLKKPDRSVGESGPKIDIDEEVRCECRNMLAKLTPVGVEIKCRRCKRVTVIPLKQDRSKRK